MYTMAYIILITVIANAIGILTGFGTGTLMMPLLLFILPYQAALLLVTIVLWFHNVWKIVLFPGQINWRLFFHFGLPGVITAYLGAMLVVQPAVLMVLPRLLGAFLVVYVSLLFFFPAFQVVQHKIIAMMGGAAQGFFAGLFAIKGPVRTVFLLAYKLPHAQYVATIGAIGLVTDSTRLCTYVYNGMRLDSFLLWGLLAIIPASYIGSKMAHYVVGYVTEGRLRVFVAVFLLIVGLRFLLLPS